MRPGVEGAWACRPTAPPHRRRRGQPNAPSARPGHNGAVEISARLEYGVRALLELARHWEQDPNLWMKADHIAGAQGIPLTFLESILGHLRQRGLVSSQRGAAGGYRLAGAPEQVTLADIVRALEGPLAGVRGQRPEDVTYPGAAAALPEVWVALRGAMRQVLEGLTLADVLTATFPEPVAAILQQPGVRQRR